MATTGRDQRGWRFESLGRTSRRSDPPPVKRPGEATSSESSSGETTTPSRSGDVSIEADPRHQRGIALAEPLRNALTPGALVGGRFILIQEIGRVC